VQLLGQASYHWVYVSQPRKTYWKMWIASNFEHVLILPWTFMYLNNIKVIFIYVYL
jgi:hypothetical protein